MKTFLLKFVLGEEIIAELRKLQQFRKPYSQEGRKLSPGEKQELLKDVWPILMSLINLIEKKGKK